LHSSDWKGEGSTTHLTDEQAQVSSKVLEIIGVSFMRTNLARFPQVRLAIVKALMWFGW
jgi:hypothetical protein